MTGISRGATHLYRQGNTYYFRYAVPADLRSTIGRRELRYSLETGYLKSARCKSRILATKATEIFNAIRSGAYSAMSKKEIRDFIDDIFRRLLDESEQKNYGGAPHLPDIFSYQAGTTEQILASYKQKLINKDYLDFLFTTYGLLRSMGDEKYVNIDIEDFKHLGHEVGKHLINFLEIQTKRAQGDYNYEKFIYPLKPTAAPVPQQAAPAGTDAQIPLSKVLESYVSEKVDTKQWTERSAYDIRSTLAQLVEILGDIPIGNINFDTMRTFKETLRKMPPNRNKLKAYRGKSIQEILAMKPEKTLSTTTFNCIMSNISGFFNWCETHGYLDRNYAQKMTIKIKQQPHTFRDAFEQDELLKLFNTKSYIKDTFLQPYMFWLPVLGLFTGARLEELCQLYVDDVLLVRDLWVIDFNENPDKNGRPDKHLKSVHSIRQTPLHPFIVKDLRFVEYCQHMKARGHERLFPELTKIRDSYGKNAGKWFKRHRLKAGVISEKLDFHSFRHTLDNHLKQKLVPVEIINEVCGRAHGDIALDRYGKPYMAEILYEEAILKLDYGLDLSHLTKSKFALGPWPK
ncbi:site-specific integrase [Desulfocurvibacter africanus]|uniref:site-specific integrase n=1 Tax=Desulfocurvibacter africanus TaxID=873 RepID=UPI002FD968CB